MKPCIVDIDRSTMLCGSSQKSTLAVFRGGEGNGNPLQCSCLENPRDWGAWWAAAYGVTQSRTRLKRLSSSSSSSRASFKGMLWLAWSSIQITKTFFPYQQ